MKIYNKGQRTIVIDRKDFLKGDVVEVQNPVGRTYAQIKPDMVCEISDEVAERLLKSYPKEIMRFGKFGAIKPKE
jgi:rRNA processing protein Gar1